MAGKVVVSTLNNDTGVLATQNGMTGIAKAWVNFNGTGTVAIRDSFNVSSITDNGTGDYTVNFTTAMPNANYSVAGFAKEFDATTNTTVNLYLAKQTIANTFATTSVRVNALAGANGGNVDSVVITVAVFSS